MAGVLSAADAGDRRPVRAHELTTGLGREAHSQGGRQARHERAANQTRNSIYAGHWVPPAKAKQMNLLLPNPKQDQLVAVVKIVK